MIRDIKYNGIAVNPSDYISNEGDLDLAVNIVNEEMSCQPILKPHIIGTIPSGWTAKYVHYNSTYRHIIVFNPTTNKLGWLDFPPDMDEVEYSEADIHILNIPEEYAEFVINSIVGVGNTLVILTDKSILYFLWKSETIGYIQLGDHLPECEMQFALVLDSSHLGLYENKVVNNKPEHGEHIQQVGTVTLTEAAGGGSYAGDITLDDNKKTENNNAVLGGVSSVMAECQKKGFFLNNFFVRYAFRLYDGSITMHSCPVLVVCSSDRMNPVVISQQTRDMDSWTVGKFEVYAPKFKLCYKSLMNGDELEKWSDIIKSVDIFITPEITNYNADGDVTIDTYHLNKTDGDLFGSSGYAERTFFIASTPTASLVNSTTPEYTKTFYCDMLKETYADRNYLKIFKTPEFSETNGNDKYKSNADFHLLYSCELKKLPKGFIQVPIEDEYLTTLSQREPMTDDNYSHDKLFAKTAFAYNSRINIANVCRIPFDGYNLTTIGPYCEKPDTNEGYTLYFYIRENGKEMVVSKSVVAGSLEYLSPFIFYPNPFVYKCVIHLTTSGKYYELPMQPHDTLNGAYYFDGFYHGNVYNMSLTTVLADEPPVDFPAYCNQISSGPTETELAAEKIIEYPNKIYTADANNPFVFSSENVNSVGASEILALASITKALSAGQFGQFPLYAFTSEGVWALEPSSTGSIASMHPVTRDVCINASSITQIDDAVLFVTARGIMLLSGSETVCISDNINTNYPFDVSALKGMNRLDNQDALRLFGSAHIFDDFIKTCNLIYDYSHQRVIVYPRSLTPDVKDVAYVYSLKSKTWAMMETSIAMSLNCYPYAICIDASNNILNYSTEDKIVKALSPQVMLTRPLKLDAPDILKTVDTVIQRGKFQRGHVSSILYGSRDLINWSLVWSSKDHYLRGFRGSPYRYFRIALLCDLAEDESIYGATVQFETRKTNQPR